MGEGCRICGGDATDAFVLEKVGPVSSRKCWPCAIRDREEEARLADPWTFLKGLGFGLALGLGAWLAFA